ncbi:hypothetical protein VB005_05501 [Metarhizium brunneum]
MPGSSGKSVCSKLLQLHIMAASSSLPPISPFRRLGWHVF